MTLTAGHDLREGLVFGGRPAYAGSPFGREARAVGEEEEVLARPGEVNHDGGLGLLLGREGRCVSGGIVLLDVADLGREP